MAVHLITYDVSDDENAATLRERIRSNFRSRCKPLLSVFVVDSEYSADQIAKFLNQFIAPGDKVLVAEVTGDWQAYGLDDGSKRWLNNHLP